MNSNLGVCRILLGKSFGGAERLFIDLTLELQQAGVDVLALCNPHTRIAAELKAAGANCVFIRYMYLFGPVTVSFTHTICRLNELGELGCRAGAQAFGKSM